MRCSTVTPGKFATFWRSPVSRLNRVDLPEFGGPTIATISGLSFRIDGDRNGRIREQTPARTLLWQSLMVILEWLSPEAGETAGLPCRREAQLRTHPPEKRGRRRPGPCAGTMVFPGRNLTPSVCARYLPPDRDGRALLLPRCAGRPKSGGHVCGTARALFLKVICSSLPVSGRPEPLSRHPCGWANRAPALVCASRS